MRREVVSDLPKLGAREYIQGGTIFNGVIAAIDAAFGSDWARDVVVSSFKLERESVANGRIVTTDEPGIDGSPNAVLVAKGPRGTIHGYYFDEGKAFRREPYDEESFNLPLRVGTDLSGEFDLPNGRPPVDFIKGVVGANKLVHQKCDRFGGELKKIQFLYLKDLDLRCLATTQGGCHLSITNLTVKETASEVWTINRVAVTSGSWSSELRLCYRAQRTA